jgi:hypothetical protein
MKSTREYTDYLQDILEATTKARQLQDAVAKILKDLKKGHNT